MKTGKKEKRNILTWVTHSHVFDLHDALPCDAAHSKYWDDEIHFTPDGYNLIGDKLGVALIGLTLEDKTASS